MVKTDEMIFECDDHRTLYNALQEMIKAGEKTTIRAVCKRAGVKNHILFTEASGQAWRSIIRQKIEQENNKWLIHGGNDCKKIESILKEYNKAGKRPVLAQILKDAGKDRGYLYDEYPWKLMLLEKIKKADFQWQEYGGFDYKKIKKAFNKIVKGGKERPTLEKVLRDAKLSKTFLMKTRFPWQANIKAEIIETSLAWQEHKKLEKDNEDKNVNTNLPGYVPHLPKGKNPDELYEQFIRQGTDIEDYKGVGVDIDIRTSALPLSIVMYSNVVLVDDPHRPQWIKPESFRSDRKPLLDALIKLVFKNRKSSNTINNYIRNSIYFIRFLDENSLTMPLNAPDTRSALQEYRLNLNAKLLQGVTLSTVKIRFNIARMFIRAIFPSDETQKIIFRKINLNIHAKKVQNTTSVDNDAAAYAVSYYYNFFHKIADFILEEEPFPRKIHLLGKNILLAPWGKRPTIHEDSSFQRINPWNFFDLEGERTLSEQEVLAQLQEETDGWDNLSKKVQYELKTIKIKGLKSIEHKIYEANNDHNHRNRMILAEIAMESFFMFFCAVTGMKDSELANIQWGNDDDFEVVKGVGKLITIKPRAQYKEIESTIHRIGVYALRKALKLRRYLLQGNECDKLFFEGHGDTIKTDKILASGTYGGKCMRRHQAINSLLPRVGTRQLKVFKNKIVLQQTGGDLWLASALVGNKPITNAEHYQGETQKKVDFELSMFVDSMIGSLKEGSFHIEETSIPQSHCENHGSPDSFIDGKKIDCNNIFACFFCKFFRVYPAKEDIHKLMSLRYIIRRIAGGRSYDQNQFNEVLEPVEELIHQLLKIMAKKHGAGELINTLQELVFKRGVLHPYWEFKLRYLHELGAF